MERKRQRERERERETERVTGRGIGRERERELRESPCNGITYLYYSRHKNNCLSCREMSVFARYKIQNQ